MSDLAAAAAALGLPEALVERSAAARAAETGASVDDILAEWAGGAPAPVAEPAEAPPPEEEPAEPETAEVKSQPEDTPEVVPTPPEEPAPAPAPAPAGPYKPPVLVGTKDNPMTVLAGVIGLFVIVVMVGVVGPSIPIDSPGARTSEIAYSDGALAGQEVYLVSGCAACHTQMIRPIVADVGLGAVTLNDTNQVLGTRRFGPDLSDVGARMTSAQIQAVVQGLGDHPSHILSATDLSDLVAYLSESVTSPPSGEGSS
jgi:cytochrome c oxidase cbb3-type subunit II